jgi:D-alanyl-D-alanine carboxypeptidase
MAALGAHRADALQAALDAAIRAGAPDMMAAVITEDGSWAGASGIAGPNDRAARADEEFAVASVTKTFTAVLVLRLAEQGALDLDEPLSSYLGDLKVDANDATVRQALEMRAGLADHGTETADQIVADPRRAWTAADRVAGYKPPIAPPGTYAYSSPSYELLALAAEHATGVSYGSALRAAIFDPVGAERILDQEAGGLTPQPWAVPIGRHLGRFAATDMGAGGALSCIASATSGTGAGSIASDAPSLAAWLWHLFAGDILADASLDQMLAGSHHEWAYGLEAAPYDEPNAVSSSGGKTGYGSQWVYFPASRAIVVTFVNDPEFIVEPTVSRLLAAALAP